MRRGGNLSARSRYRGCHPARSSRANGSQSARRASSTTYPVARSAAPPPDRCGPWDRPTGGRPVSAVLPAGAPPPPPPARGGGGGAAPPPPEKKGHSPPPRGGACGQHTGMNGSTLPARAVVPHDPQMRHGFTARGQNGDRIVGGAVIDHDNLDRRMDLQGAVNRLDQRDDVLCLVLGRDNDGKRGHGLPAKGVVRSWVSIGDRPRPCNCSGLGGGFKAAFPLTPQRIETQLRTT